MSTLATTDPVADRVLDLVSERESAGNYDAVIGHMRGVDMDRDGAIDHLRDMTISQIYTLEAKLLASGMPSTAVGRYQDIMKTLKALVAEEGLDADTTQFTDEVQDRLNLRLLNDACQFHNWRAGICTDEKFAHLLSRQWASLPDPLNGGKSHYDGDGVNHAGMSLDHVYSTLAAAKAPGSVGGDLVGVAVRALQSALNSTGAKLTVDGDMGERTMDAYRDYRKDHP